MKKGLLAISIFAALLMGAVVVPSGPANADTISFDLTQGNTAISGFAGPYATVTITASGGNATVTFTGDNGYLIGDGGSVGLNVVGGTATLSNFSWTGGNGFTAFTDAGSSQLDGFGTFNSTANNFDGAASAVTSVTFTVSGTFANASSVLFPNPSGHTAASHIFILNASATTCGDPL